MHIRQDAGTRNEQPPTRVEEAAAQALGVFPQAPARHVRKAPARKEWEERAGAGRRAPGSPRSALPGQTPRPVCVSGGWVRGGAHVVGFRDWSPAGPGGGGTAASAPSQPPPSTLSSQTPEGCGVPPAGRLMVCSLDPGPQEQK